jgi:hypothetical protein
VSDLPQLTRRTALRLLAIGTLAAAAGCRPTGPRATPTGSASTSVTVSPDAVRTTPAPAPSESATEVLVKRVADAERALLAAYDAAAANHPDMAAGLWPLRADHAAHLQGLLPGATTSTDPSTQLFSAPPLSAAASATAISSASDLVLDELAALERAAAAARVDDVSASTGSLARVLASIGGCEAAHAALLAVRT